MRSLPAIILAALTAVAIAVSALLTASHFGMRDWPTPPMPDTATRLITPTEAAGRVSDRISRTDEPVDVTVTVDAGGSESRRAERRARKGARPRAERNRRGTSRRGDRGGRRPGGRDSGSGDRRPETETDAPDTQQDADPTAPAPADPAAVAPAGAGDQTQARPDVSGPPVPPVVPDVVVADPPIAIDEQDDDDAPGPDAGADDDSTDPPNDGRGRDRGRGSIRDLLGQLR